MKEIKLRSGSDIDVPTKTIEVRDSVSRGSIGASGYTQVLVPVTI